MQALAGALQPQLTPRCRPAGTLCTLLPDLRSALIQRLCPADATTLARLRSLWAAHGQPLAEGAEEQPLAEVRQASGSAVLRCLQATRWIPCCWPLNCAGLSAPFPAFARAQPPLPAGMSQLPPSSPRFQVCIMHLSIPSTNVCCPASLQVCLDCDPDAPSYKVPACRVLGQYGLQTTASKLSSPAVQAVLARLRGAWGSGRDVSGTGVPVGGGGACEGAYPSSGLACLHASGPSSSADVRQGCPHPYPCR